MTRTAALALAAVAVAAAAPPAPAVDLGLGIFKRKPKPDAAAKVKQTVATLQADLDEKRRRQAAEELREYDPRANADVIPALIASLQQDPSPAVRAEAAASLGKLKPVQQPAGIVMETVLSADPDPKVREAVKAALWQYHLNGYRTPAGQALATPTAEPPLAAVRPDPVTVPVRVPAADAGFRPITNGVGAATRFTPTAEPPLAKSLTLPAPEVPPPAPVIGTPPLPTVTVPTTPLPTITVPAKPGF